MKKKVLIFCGLLMLNILIIPGYSVAAPKYEMPVLISSAGQSADVKLVGMLAKRGDIEHTIADMATAKDLEGMKTLIFVPGFSSKGLGAAGVSAEDEIARVKALIIAAKEKNIPIVLVHVGGSARRMGQSEMFIEEVLKNSEALIVVEQGNQDELFSKKSKELDIPLTLVPRIASAGEPLKQLFK